MGMSQTGIEYVQGNTKRSLDILGGLGLAVALAPAVVAVGTVGVCEGRSLNPLFYQTRDNGDGSTLRVRKFRTIRETVGATVTNGTFDERASRVCQIIRQTGLDETPQLLAVITGSMSLVGPRPLLSQDIERMADAGPELFDDWYRFYGQAKKGIMGFSNAFRHHFIHGANESVYRRSMELDMRYMETASLTTDLRVIGRTPLLMVRANMATVDNSGEDSEAVENMVAMQVIGDQVREEAV